MWVWIINQDWLTLITSAGSVATAIATVFLWRVTKGLYDATQVMAKATSRAQVVANIYPNIWSMNYLDLSISNTGNATAFDIRISFEPDLEKLDAFSNHQVPLKKISALRPGDSIQSTLCEFIHLCDTPLVITTSWKDSPTDTTAQSITYDFNVGNYNGTNTLVASRPDVQIAQELTAIRKYLHSTIEGGKRANINVYSGYDRASEKEKRDAFRRLQRERSADGTIDPPSASSP